MEVHDDIDEECSINHGFQGNNPSRVLIVHKAQDVGSEDSSENEHSKVSHYLQSDEGLPSRSNWVFWVQNSWDSVLSSP